MLTIYFPPLVALIGALIFVFAKNNPDLKEIGRITFAMGLLVSLLVFGHGSSVHIP